MSVTPGPWAIPSSMRNGRSAAVPGSNTVSMWPMSSDARPAGRCRGTSPTTVSPKRPAGSGRTSTSAPSSRRKPAGPAPDLVDALRRVRAAVDVHEALEVVEVGRQVGGDGRAERVELEDRADRSGRHCGRHRAAVYRDRRRLAILPGPCAWSRSALLEGPNVYRLEPVVKLEVADRPAADLVRPARSRPPRARPARRRGAGPRLARSGRRRRRLDPAPAGGPRGRPWRPRRPSLVRPRALDRDLPVGRRGTGPAHHRGGPRPGRARRVAVEDGAADRRPGAAARALDRTDRRGPRHAATVDPGRGPAGAGRVDLRDQRQVDRDPAHHPHPAAGRAARRDHDLGRRPVDERMVEPGDWTGPGGAQQVLRRSDIDVAVLETARGGIVLRGMGYESNDASVLTNVSSDHLDLQGIHTLPELAEVKATICRVTKPVGLGRAQRRRPARGRGRTARCAATSRISRWRAARCRAASAATSPTAVVRTPSATAG